MARNLRSRGRGKGKGASKNDPMVLDLSSSDVYMQDAPLELTSSLSEAIPRVRTRSHPSSHVEVQKTSPVKTRNPRRKSLPEPRATPASSRSKLRPSASHADNVKKRPEYEFTNRAVGHPPGYVRSTPPNIRQTNEEGWPYGVLNGGAIIRMLEDLSSSSQPLDWQVCIQLEAFAARFGRFHTSDGLIVTNRQETHFLMLACRIWVALKGDNASADVLWVPGLEPRAMPEPDWEAKANHGLPELPEKYHQKLWFAGEMQYMYYTIERPRKATIVHKDWIDDMGWTRDIWQA